MDLDPIMGSSSTTTQRKIARLEEDLARLSSGMEAELARRQGEEEAEKRSWLERVASCQRALERAADEAERAKQAAARDKAALQVGVWVPALVRGGRGSAREVVAG